MRAARPMAIALRLQQTGFRTAGQLAAELEVSTRTIYRDVEALQAAGVPIWTTAGEGGGIRIDPGWRSPVDGLTSEEIAALLVDPDRAESAGLGAALRTARASLSGSSSAGVAELLAWFDERFIVDPTPWFQPPALTERPALLPIVARALRHGRRLHLDYQSDSVVRGQRIDPLGVVQKHGIHYLVAAHRGKPRSFRVSRIAGARVLDVAVIVPEGFDLGAYWSGFVEAFESEIRPIEARLRVRAVDLQQLRRAVPGRATERALATAEIDGDWSTIVVTVEELPVAAQQLASVPSVEVLGPPALRRALAAHCEVIHRRHQGTPSDEALRD